VKSQSHLAKLNKKIEEPSRSGVQVKSQEKMIEAPFKERVKKAELWRGQLVEGICKKKKEAQRLSKPSPERED